MAEHPNALRVRAAIDAHQRSDRQTLEELYAADVCVHLGGSHPRAGDHRGRDVLFDYFECLHRRADGRIRLELQAILADDERCAVIVHITIEGKRPLDVLEAQTFRVDRHGRFCEYWALADDQASVDAFWS